MFNNSSILSYLSSPRFFFLNVIVFDIAIELGSQFIFHQFLSLFIHNSRKFIFEGKAFLRTHKFLTLRLSTSGNTKL